MITNLINLFRIREKRKISDNINTFLTLYHFIVNANLLQNNIYRASSKTVIPPTKLRNSNNIGAL